MRIVTFSTYQMINLIHTRFDEFFVFLKNDPIIHFKKPNIFQTSTMKQNAYFSYSHKKLVTGCQLCVKGKKSVVYITGLCPRRCYFCPLSAQRQYVDVQYANERKVKSTAEIIEEIKTCGSTGCSFTGGDPLVTLKRTCDTIRALKKEFGKSFHTHLYTSLNLVTAETLARLHTAGLDEIRFHPDFDDRSLWNRIKLAQTYDWLIGIEIPAIPGKQETILELLDFAQSHIDFLNLNELEISPRNVKIMHQRGFYCKSPHSYAIKGSLTMMQNLLKIIKKKYPHLAIHACTSKLKDAVQLKNRFKQRAKNIKKTYQLIEDDGTLLYGKIVGDIKVHNENARILKTHHVPTSLYEMHENDMHIALWVLVKLQNTLAGKKYRINQYPTHDKFIVREEEL